MQLILGCTLPQTGTTAGEIYLFGMIHQCVTAGKPSFLRQALWFRVSSCSARVSVHVQQRFYLTDTFRAQVVDRR